MIVTKSSKKTEKHENPLEISLNREQTTKILEAVNFERAFFFYEGLGKPTGEFAISLSDFCNKINVVSTKSLAFHLKRGDFQRWISDVIGDAELAKRLNKIKVKESNLKNVLHEFVKGRINELKEMWPILLALP